MSVSINMAHTVRSAIPPDDRRRSYTDFELKRKSDTRLSRPQMRSHNGVVTFTQDSEVPRNVSLRRATSLRVGGEKVPRKKNPVTFDLHRDNSYHGSIDVSSFNGTSSSGPKKPPRLKIPEEAEDDDGKSSTDNDATSFNSAAIRKSISEGFDKIRRASIKDLVGVSPDIKKERRRSSNYVQIRDEEGDWKRYSLRPSSEFEVYHHSFKVMLLGDSCVGKTCLLTRFKDGTFLAGTFISTVGIDFRNKVVTVDGAKVKLQIWDTAGQERFRSVTHAYYRDAHALLLLYDVMSKTSFDNTRAWLAEVHEYAQDDVVIMLIGNKCDVNGDRVVRREDGERLAREYNVAFMETSAKTGLNVDLAFMAVARELKARKSSNPTERKFNVADYVRQEAKTDSCLCTVG